MKSDNLKLLGIIVLVIVLIGTSAYNIYRDLSGGAGSSKEEIEKIIAEYIDKNPQAILDSVTKHQENQAQEVLKNAREQIAGNKDEIIGKNQPTAGNKDGDITVVEFFDYACGYCKKAFPGLKKLLDEDKNVKVIFKEFPILSPNSLIAAKAALAVNMIAPEKYLAFHTALITGQISGEESVLTIADKLGLDRKAISAKMNSEEINNILAENRQTASKLGINGTPAFIIGNELVPGFMDYEELAAQVKKARE